MHLHDCVVLTDITIILGFSQYSAIIDRLLGTDCIYHLVTEFGELILKNLSFALYMLLNI